MKHSIIVLLVIGFLFCLSCFFEKKPRQYERTNAPATRLYCINGYKFAIYSGGFDGGITQIFENTPDGIRAMECRNESEKTQ